MRAGKCNGKGHVDCDCGFGGVYYAATDTPIPPAGTTASWGRTDFSAPSTCPRCRAPVFFVRHNGGSVWFDSPGQPWPKHPCMATEPDMAWLSEALAAPSGATRRFGVIDRVEVAEPGARAVFVIREADGTITHMAIQYTENPCDVLGSLAVYNSAGDGDGGVFPQNGLVIRPPAAQLRGRHPGPPPMSAAWLKERSAPKTTITVGFGNVRRSVGFSLRAKTDDLVSLFGFEPWVTNFEQRLRQAVVALGPLHLAQVASTVKVIVMRCEKTADAKIERRLEISVRTTEIPRLFGESWPTDETCDLVIQRVDEFNAQRRRRRGHGC